MGYNLFMKISWNHVTWYSKIASVVLFVLVFYVGFFLGKYKASVIAPDPEFTISASVKPINIVAYTCNIGKVIIAKYYQGENKPAVKPDQPPTPGGSVALSLSDGRSVTLAQTISADGARYADPDESFVFWSKGNGAFVTENNSKDTTYKNCVVASQEK
jgi:membrane-bound inhibitor of C-type lysozyme